MSRIEVNVNKDWLFNPCHSPSHLEPLCDDRDFERVHLPHTNRLVPSHGFDDRLYQFVSTYRKHLDVDPKWKGRRIYMDFGAAMTVAEVYVNGRFAHEHKGGYTPFSVELTPFLEWRGKNVVAVKLDSTERPDVPPFGGQIDYLTFGGLYRDVTLRAVNPSYFQHVFVSPGGIHDGAPYLTLRAALSVPVGAVPPLRVRFAVSTQDGEPVLQGESELHSEEDRIEAAHTFRDVQCLDYWDLDAPKLYRADVELISGEGTGDVFQTRFGFREARFTPDGFMLNGRTLFLRGLNRHQTYPWVGNAMPARVQRRDADILKKELNCHIVRTSHYPQSRHFLDRCDEIGLLVFEEIPGWQHLGDQSWKEVACQNVREMIERDYNHPAIVLWGVRVNESADDDGFYTETNRIAHELDETRQTTGARFVHDSKLLEDVFAFNDFESDAIKAPNHPCYLISEFCGHTYPTKNGDNVERITRHTYRHAHILSQAAMTPGIAGAIGWCAFDYNTHGDFGSGDRVCHHGVADMFRIPKYAAGLYMAQCDPADRPVLEPAFSWSCGDFPGGGGVGRAIINSNCDSLRIYLGDEYVTELSPARDIFPGLEYPPFFLNDMLMSVWGARWKPLLIEGCLNGQIVITRSMSGTGVNHDLLLRADDATLSADGNDATRVWFMITDEFGNRQNFASAALSFTLEGPATLIGDNPFALIGGSGAVWVRATHEPGEIRLSAKHTILGEKTVRINVICPHHAPALFPTADSLAPATWDTAFANAPHRALAP